MKGHKKIQQDLGTSPLFPLAMKLAIPTALAQAVNVLYAIIDRMFIGHIAGVGGPREKGRPSFLPHR